MGKFFDEEISERLDRLDGHIQDIYKHLGHIETRLDGLEISKEEVIQMLENESKDPELDDILKEREDGQ